MGVRSSNPQLSCTRTLADGGQVRPVSPVCLPRVAGSGALGTAFLQAGLGSQVAVLLDNLPLARQLKTSLPQFMLAASIRDVVSATSRCCHRQGHHCHALP